METSTIQKTWKPTTLIIGGGSERCFVEFGAIHELEKSQLLTDVTTFIGVSSGAFIALMLSIDMTAREMIELAIENDFIYDVTSVTSTINLLTGNDEKLMNFINSLNLKIAYFAYDLSKFFGLIKAENQQLLKEILTAKLKSKLGYNPTLRQLHLATGLTFVAVTYNLDSERTIYLSHETFPDMLAVDAVVLAMNIALPYKLTYKNEVYIDAGFHEPYPVVKYDREMPEHEKILGVCTLKKIQGTLDLQTPSYVDKILNALISKQVYEAQKLTSRRCKHIIISSNTQAIDYTSYSSEKGSMIVQGCYIADLFIRSLNEDK
jgi:Predicted esterase of the alpha-beta hydrolase superfamily